MSEQLFLSIEGVVEAHFWSSFRQSVVGESGVRCFIQLRDNEAGPRDLIRRRAVFGDETFASVEPYVGRAP
ncbi:unnamed protein product, partial [Toxocara canis]|uniref:DUF2218 domain-containing protein n=1 Tax=Toxocara canis TaxID=6265 RepID=A0A183U618_TOXCA